MLSARKGHSIIYHGSYIYVFGGFDDSGIIKDCEKYDPTIDQWIPMIRMIYAKAYATPLVYNNNVIFLIGGFSNMKIDGVYLIKLEF
jgi:N-acetylneuraminic acid mutarotase